MMQKTMLRSVLAVAAMFACTAALAAEAEIGSKAAAFEAQGVDGKEYTLDSFKDAKAVVLCFTCNDCPVARGYEDRFIEFTRKYQDKGVRFIAINCNNQSEGLEAMKRHAEEQDFNFPYAFDASGKAAQAYGARVTPHLFVLNGKGEVAYRGAFDDSQQQPKEHYVADAVESILAGKQPEVTSTKAFGCGIRAKVAAK